jgi:hypothetical protein
VVFGAEDELTNCNCKELIEEYEQALHPKLPVKKRGRPSKGKENPLLTSP